jgi:tetratricopeptide (TPR) repeat protein
MERSLMSALGLSDSLLLRSLEPATEHEDPSKDVRRKEKRGRLLAIGSVVTLTFLMVLGARILANRSGDSNLQVGSESVATIAVLGFDNQTGDAGLDWLRTGLAELLVTDLAQSQRIHVLPVSATLGVRKEGEPPPMPDELARRMGVETIIRGSFVSQGSDLQVNIRALDAKARTIATRSVKGQLDHDLFGMVDQLGLAIRQSLGVQSGAEDLLEQELADVTTKSAEAYRYYAEGLSLQYRGKVVESVPLYARAVEIDPGFALALSKLSILAGIRGDIDRALEFSARAMKELDGVSLRERYYIEGNHYSWREETYGQAIASFERALELYPDHWPARHNLGVMYWELERYSQAIESFEFTRSRRPELLYLYHPLALSYAGVGDFASGLEVEQASVVRSEGASTAYEELGDFLTLWGRQDEALEAYANARKAAPRLFDFEFHRWRIHVLREDWEALDEWIGKRDTAELESEQALVLSIALLYRGRPRESLDVLDRVAARAGERSRARAAAQVAAAQLLLDLERPAEAVAHARLAQQAGKGDLGEWRGLFVESLASAALGDTERAQTLSDRLASNTAALSTLREKCRHELQLGLLALNRGDSAMALNQLRSARSALPAKGILWTARQPPLHVPVWYASAQAYLSVSDLASAEDNLRRIVESHSERLLWPVHYARSLHLLARILEEQGDLEGARRFDERFVKQWARGDIDSHSVLVSKSKR